MQRRTQESRSEDTRHKLLRATVALLLERGYTRLATPEIARRAGVSRGALTYHFTNREDIVVRSLALQLAEATEGLRPFCDEHPAPSISSNEVLDHLWSMMAEGLFHTTLEYLPEARNNDEFRERLLPVVREFHAALDAIWGRLVERYGTTRDHARVAMNASMCLIRGMIAQTVLRDDPAYYWEMLEYWKAHLRADFQRARIAPRTEHAA